MPLPEEGSPDVLDLDAQLMLQAWQRDHPSVEAVFWFDIVGPPAP